MNLPQALHTPAHLAIIMDGNGRWAELRGRNRTFGHLKGARVAKQMIEFCAHSGIKHLTLYAFSTENWMRPQNEVSFLMRLLARHLRRERRTLMKNKIRFSVIGEISRLPEAVQQEVRTTLEETCQNTGMNLTFALSYGSRQEMTMTVKEICQDVQAARLQISDITEDFISSRLQTGQMPDPDLIIRTSGEHRLSNFMLWQAAYSELYITPTLWPEFTAEDLKLAFHKYAKTERRFGRTTEQVKQVSIRDLMRLTRFRQAGI